jgi:hypothetical protein
MIPVKDIELKKGQSANNLVKQFYGAGGFSAKKVADGVDILETMFKDKSCKRMLSLPAAPISTGMRGVVKDLVKNKMVDCVITTCGLLDHDFARVWKDYFHGNFAMDDIELHKKGVYRLGNILIPKDNYGSILEDKIQPVIEKLYAKGVRNISTKDFIWALGESLEKEKNRESSIIYWAWNNKIPIFVPGPTDGAVGSQVWYYSLYWLIPMVLYFAPKNLFLRSLGSTFTAHAIGSVLFLYSIPTAPALWIMLLPIVAIERLVFAAGISASFVAFNSVLDAYFADQKFIAIDKRYSLANFKL